MPQFCRHNRLLHNCPICSREQDLELRPLISSSAPTTVEPRRPPRQAASRASRTPRAGRTPGLTVRRLRDSVDDGFASPLVPGLRSSEEARRLAEELAFAERRLTLLRTSPPGLYEEVADPAGDLEERTWLAFLIAYLGPLEGEEDPFAAIRRVRTTWSSGELPALEEVETGPRSAHDLMAPQRTTASYRAWAERAGSQAAGMQGDQAWAPGRRFARTYERLALPGLHRDARYELLVSLGTLAVYPMTPGTLALGGSDAVTVAAKRALGIGDPMLLEKRASNLAEGAGVSPAALDLGFYNWERGQRATVGSGAEAAPSEELLAGIGGALGL